MKASHHLTLVFLWVLSAVLLGTTPVHAAPGDLDSLDANVVGGVVFATAIQADGKTIIAGAFSSVLGQPRNNIARLNANGTLDAGFNPNVSGTILSVALQADGKILLGGDFTTVGGTTRNRIARVAANGTLDAGFDPNADSGVYSMAVQADGKILLGGNFNTVSGTGRNYVARLEAAGTLDAGFNPNMSGAVFSVAVQADAQILLGGTFTTVGGTTRNRIARVAANGTLDAAFNPNVSGAVNSVAVQADGKILLGGNFTSVGGTTRNCIARVAANGTLDAGFNPNANMAVYSVVVQADGKILLAGDFTSVGGTTRNKIARVAANGTLDADFNPDASITVISVALQADGQILIGGTFANVGGTYRNLFARLLNDPATQTLSATDTSQVTWTRGGSSPEIAQVTFEQSTDSGTTWTALGSATRMGSTPNWQLAGLNLPNSVQLRARGRASGGTYSGSSGLIEQVASFSGLLPAPGIDVTQASLLVDGISNVAFGTVFVGSSAPRTFTVTNPGNADLTDLVVTTDGTDSGDFIVSALSATSIPVGAGTSTFTVTFSPTATGAKTAAIHIASNVTGTKNPFDIFLTGTGRNNAPTISNIANQTINEDGNTGALTFTIGDVETAAASLTASGSSSNTTLVPNGNIVFSGSGATRSAVVTPAANQFGTATITVAVSDGNDSVSDTFLLTVTSVNDEPTISNLTDQTINEDVSTGAIALTIGDVETAAGSLTVTGASSNTTLVPTANIMLGGTGASRTVTVTPAANQFGTTTITVTVSDGSASANDTFLLTVNSVNDAPTISNITDQSIGVNTLTNSLPFTVGDVETAAAALTVSGTSSNQTLVPDGSIFFSGSGANRTVTVVPESNRIGTVTISVSVIDGLLTSTDTFVLTVLGADIAVEQPFNSNIANGGTKSFGNVAVGANSSLNFVIKNTGNADLTGLTITKDGADAGMFTVTANPTAPVSGPNGTTAFTVRFAPTSVGLKTAAIHIASNDPDESPFDITLTGGPPEVPEIAVERSGVNITDGGSVGIVTATVGSPVDAVFTMRNTGTAPLALSGIPAVVVSGTDAALFSVIAQPASSVGPDQSTTFIVRYAAPDSSTKTATLSIATDDADENPFDITLTGAVLSFTTDTDGDGISDASEFQMATLGFDWQVHQASLVTTLKTSASGAGFYTLSQVQALNVGTPLLQRNPTTGQFTLTIGLEKSIDLSTFSPFPMTAPGTSAVINGEGKLEFLFTVPDNAAFFQLKAQ
jgi:uncharacterized delta-60 repeat protein